MGAVDSMRVPVNSSNGIEHEIAMRSKVASGYCRYVGRIGALALVWGVGAAIAFMPAAAFADAGGSASSVATSSSTPSG